MCIIRRKSIQIVKKPNIFVLQTKTSNTKCLTAFHFTIFFKTPTETDEDCIYLQRRKSEKLRTTVLNAARRPRDVGRSLMRRRLDRPDVEDPEDPRSIAMTNRETRPGGSLCDAKRPHRDSFYSQGRIVSKTIVRTCS